MTKLHSSIEFHCKRNNEVKSSQYANLTANKRLMEKIELSCKFHQLKHEFSCPPLDEGFRNEGFSESGPFQAHSFCKFSSEEMLFSIYMYTGGNSLASHSLIELSSKIES